LRTKYLGKERISMLQMSLSFRQILGRNSASTIQQLDILFENTRKGSVKKIGFVLLNGKPLNTVVCLYKSYDRLTCQDTKPLKVSIECIMV